MLTNEKICEILQNVSLSQKDTCMLLLAYDSCSSKRIKEVIALGVSCGVHEIVKWNVSRALKSEKGIAFHIENVWRLTYNGKKYLYNLLSENFSFPIVQTISSLRSHLEKIGNSTAKIFVAESVSCFENRLFRSAVVLSWVGAVAVLQGYVFSNKLSEVNSELLRQGKIKRPIGRIEDFSKVKEFDFLSILASIGLVSKSVKHELEARLKLRNGCGHPNELVVGEHQVAAHIESLIDNVFAKFC